jgi:peptidase inhibitor family I36
MGVKDCPAGKVCTWDQPDFKGNMQVFDPPSSGEVGCHNVNVRSLVNNTNDGVFVFPNQGCTGSRTAVLPANKSGQSNGSVTGASIGIMDRPTFLKIMAEGIEKLMDR